MVINLTLEDYFRMEESGTLDSYLLSNGIMFQDALHHLLSLTTKRVEDIEELVDELEGELKVAQI